MRVVYCDKHIQMTTKTQRYFELKQKRIHDNATVLLYRCPLMIHQLICLNQSFPKLLNICNKIVSVFGFRKMFF